MSYYDASTTTTQALDYRTGNTPDSAGYLAGERERPRVHKGVSSLYVNVISPDW
jgi:hypothetical protein